MEKKLFRRGILRILLATAIVALISGICCAPILASIKIYPDASKGYAYQAPVTTTVLTAVPGSSTYGESVTFTATVTGDAETPTGSVEFFIDNNSAGVEPLTDGAADLVIDSLPAGNHSVVASFTGSDAYEGSISASVPLSYTVSAKNLTVSGITANDKEYDRTRNAALNASGAVLVGVVGSDDVNLDTSVASGLFADKNVGDNKPVTISGLSLNGSAASNYTLTPPVPTAEITARILTVNATGTNRIYNGTTNATVSWSDDRITGDVFTVSYASAAFLNKNVGNSKPITVSGISLSGADAGNYTLAGTPSATANITARTLTVTASGVNKVYDGTTSAQVSANDNRIAGDVLTIGATSAVFGNKNVGTGKTVTVSEISLSGTDSVNYSLASTTCTATANITARTLTVTVTGVDKVYDGTTSAQVGASDNRIAGDVLTINATSAVFGNKNVGTGKIVTVSGIVKSGVDAANYSLSGTTAVTTASITARPLTVSATGADKTYDGTTDASGSLSDDRISGDVMTITSTSAVFSDKYAGNGKTIIVSGISKSGIAAGNYTLVNTECTTSANITSRDLTVTATGTDKVYDGTTATTVTLSDNRLPGDILTVNYGSAVFADANVGTGKPVGVNGLAITGADAINYHLPASVVSTSANITRASPVFSNLSAPTIDEGTAATALGGYLKSGTLVPTSQVSISLRVDADNTVTQMSGINAGNGAFSSSFGTANLAIGTYTILYGYSGDNNFNPLPDTSNTATLTVQTAANGGGGNPPGGSTGGTGSSGGGGGGVSSVNSTLTLKGLVSNTGNPVVNPSGIVQGNVQLKSNDSNVTLTMTQGTELKDASGKALASMTATKNQVLNAPPDGVIVVAYDFGPDGAKFNPAMTLTISYDPAVLPKDMTESSLYIAYWDGFKWASVNGVLNTANHSVTAKISHFSVYSLIGQATAPTPTPVSTQTPTTPPSPAPSTALTPTPIVETSPAATTSTVTRVPSNLPSALPVIPAPPAAISPDITTGNDSIATSPPDKPVSPFSMMLLIYISVFVVAMILTVLIVLRQRRG